VRIFSEVTTLYTSLASNGGFDFGTAINSFTQSNFPGFQVPEITVNFNESIRQGLTWFIQNFGSLFSGVAQALFIGFLSLLGLFFFLKDGKKLKRWTINLLPLSPKYTEEIIYETSLVVHSVTSGILIVAIIQGLVAGLGFFLFNIPNAAFWGTVVVFSSLVPIVGTWLVVVPAIAYLFFTGQTALSISLAIWSVILVNLIYNVLSPQLMGRGNNIHPFVILLSVLGGIVFLGPIGFLVGPFVIAFLFSLLNIYPKLILKGSSSLRGKR
jgi:predicted PurR-regulated permease PerM